MNIALAQINPVTGDFAGNIEKILDYTRKAKSLLADMVVFPELCICGYPPMDLLSYEGFVDENIRALRRIQKECPRDITVILGYADRNRLHKGKALRNRAAVIQNGTIIHTQAKSLLPTYDVFDETRYFEASDERRLFTAHNRKIGIAICEDIWWEKEITPGARYPVDPVREFADLGADIIISPSASPFHAGKPALRQSLLGRIGKTASLPVVYVNMVGGNDELIFDGNSMITDKSGALVYKAASFREDLVCVDIESAGPAEITLEEKYDEIEKALVLGIKDYVKKCGFHDVHLGLSGGIDSALVAVLAVKALGAEHVTAFSLPSRYSSEGSKTDAYELAENLSIACHTVPIENIFPQFLQALEPFFGGSEPDTAEENIQARIRGTLLMGYSNKRNSLLLTTGNKSELAVGYCTLYGDMSGGLAVIGDLLKTDVYGLCGHINSREHSIPEAILTKAPSAELRPDQKDQDSLPPYDILDPVLDYYLVQFKTAEEITALGFDADLVRGILKLVARAEYKRRQAPPVLKVSPKAFGSGRRMPIARELYEI